MASGMKGKSEKLMICRGKLVRRLLYLCMYHAVQTIMFSRSAVLRPTLFKKKLNGRLSMRNHDLQVSAQLGTIAVRRMNLANGCVLLEILHVVHRA